MDRVHNFNAGPAALPLPVLQQVQQLLPLLRQAKDLPQAATSLFWTHSPYLSKLALARILITRLLFPIQLFRG